MNIEEARDLVNSIWTNYGLKPDQDMDIKTFLQVAKDMALLTHDKTLVQRPEDLIESLKPTKEGKITVDTLTEIIVKFADSID